MEPKTEPTTEQTNGGWGGAIPVPPAPEPDDDGIVNLDRARQAKERANQGIRFKLNRTGGYARVRRFNALDRLAIGQLPAAQQQRVLNALAGGAQPDNAKRTDGSVSVPIVLRNMKNNEEMVDAYAVAGFIEPRLIFSEADRTDPDQIPVDLIDTYDKQVFFAWCQTDAEVAADRIAPFPQESSGPVVAG